MIKVHLVVALHLGGLDVASTLQCYSCSNSDTINSNCQDPFNAKNLTANNYAYFSDGGVCLVCVITHVLHSLHIYSTK